MMRGCLEVSVETCRVEGRQQSLGKWYNGCLGHLKGQTMGPIVISPLTYGTFSTNRFDPQVNHADYVFFLAEAVESNSWACLSECTNLSVFDRNRLAPASQVHFSISHFTGFQSLCWHLL